MNNTEKYSIETLEDIMLDAKLGLSIYQISVRLCINYKEFYKDFCDENTKIKLYYDSGISQGRAETDKALFDLAKNGSTAAKTSYDEKLIDAHLSNRFLEIFNS